MSKGLLSGPYLLWMAAFTIILLALIVYYGLANRTGASTMADIMTIAAVGHPKALWLPPGLSLISTTICLLLAYPLAMILRNRGIDKGSLVILIFILPMWVNFLSRTLVWQTLLEEGDVVNSILTALHLSSQSLTNALGTIILGMAYSFLPLMALPIYNVLYRINDNTINAARDLGANFTQTLVRIWIPLGPPGIISDIVMALIPALTTFVISSLLGGSKTLLIGNVIGQEPTKRSNWHLGSGLSLILMVFVLISIALIAKYDEQGEGAAFQ